MVYAKGKITVTFQVSDNSFLFVLELVEALHFFLLLSQLVSHLIQPFLQLLFLLIREGETDMVEEEERAEGKPSLAKPW